MKVNKFIMLGLLAVTAVGIYMVKQMPNQQHADSHGQEVKNEQYASAQQQPINNENTRPPSMGELRRVVEKNDPMFDEQVAINKANNPKVEQLDALQRSIVKLSDDELLAELENLKSSIYKSGLVRQNPEQVDLNNHPTAKEVLTRLSLVRVEMAKRGLREQSADRD